MDGRLLIAFAAILWGTTGTAQALAPATATPLAVGALRLLVGGVALVALATANGQLRLERQWLRPATGLACLVTALYQISFFAGVALTGVAIGTLVAIGSAPIFAGILGKLVHGETLRWRWWLATLLAILGCAGLAFSGGTSGTVNMLGIALSLGAGLSYAAFATVNKALLTHFHPNAVMAVSFGGGALLLSPLLLFVDIGWAFTANGALVVLHLGLIATGLSYFFFGRGLRTTTVAVAGTLSLVEPLTATILSVLVLGERLTLTAMMGVLLLFAGLIILVLPQPAQTRQLD